MILINSINLYDVVVVHGIVVFSLSMIRYNEFFVDINIYCTLLLLLSLPIN